MIRNALLDHFEHPRNYGEIQKADGIGCAGMPAKGITIKMWIRIEDGVIKDITFKTAGCAASIASASVVTELVKGITVEEALLFSPAEVSRALGGIPEEKMHCSRLAVESLQNALADYWRRTIQASKPSGMLQKGEVV